MWIVLPIKNLDQAKQRLASELTPGERRELFLTMLRDVLTALAQVKGLDGILLVSRDPAATALSEEFGTALIDEPANIGQSEAVQRGVDWIIARGGKGVVTIPGDAPLISAAEVEDLLSVNSTGDRALTLSPSHDRRGTNCVVARPANLINFHFGHQSFQPHLAEAEKAGMTARIRPLPGIGLDIDTPEDVLKFLDVDGPQTGTRRFLEQTGIADRLRQLKSNLGEGA